MHAWRLLREHLAFRRFWLALLLVMLADEMMRTTLIWHVYASTGSAEAVSVLLVCMTGPILVSGLLAGWLLDRFPRGRVMAADTGFRAVLLLLVSAAMAMTGGGVLLFYLVGAVQGALLMVLLAGAPSVIATLVAEDGRAAANALESIGFSLALAVGPFLAGQVIAHGGVVPALLLAALCYAGFAFAVRGMAVGGGRAPAAGAPLNLRQSGLLHPAIVTTTAMFALFNLGIGLLLVWLPILVATRLGGGAATYGALMAVNGAGLTLGALLAGRVRDVDRMGLAICAAQVLSAALLLMLALRLPLLLVYAAVLGFGVCSGPMTVWAQTLRMRLVAPEWHGRAFAVLRMLMQSGRPVGGALAGVALAVMPLGLCVAFSAAIIGVPAVLGALHPAIRNGLGA